MSKRGLAPGTIRAAALLGFRRLASNMGADADALLEAAGIDPQSLDSPDNRISYPAMIALLEDCAEELACSDFGLRLSRYQNMDILGPAAMIAQYSDTVGDCLNAIATYLYVHTNGAVVRVSPVSRDLTSLTFEVLLPGLHTRRQINELSLGIGQSILEMLISAGFRCRQVQFTHRRPTDLVPLIERFGASLSFGEPINGLIFEKGHLAKPVATANAEFHDIALAYIHDHLRDTEEHRLRSVLLLVHQFLPTGRCSLEAVARVLGMHPRTLQRELRELGSDFRGIVDRARRELASDYLANTDASLTQISAMLGYSDQAAFTTAFRRWFGTTPGRWRRLANA